MEIRVLLADGGGGQEIVMRSHELHIRPQPLSAKAGSSLSLSGSLALYPSLSL